MTREEIEEAIVTEQRHLLRSAKMGAGQIAELKKSVHENVLMYRRALRAPGKA